MTRPPVENLFGGPGQSVPPRARPGPRRPAAASAQPAGLFELTPQLTKVLTQGRGDAPAPEIPLPPLPEGVIRLDLPRWDTAWEVKTGRGGWPKVDIKTGKTIKHRKVWDALKGNARNAHFAQRHKATKEVITAVADVATRAGLRPCAHLTVQLVWAPGRRFRADDDNLWNLQKVCCDALARGPRGKRPIPGLQLVPDDTREWMEKLAPRIDWPPEGELYGPSGLWLEVQVTPLDVPV